MRIRVIVLMALLVMAATDVIADEAFKPSAQVRHRFESDARDFLGDTRPKSFNLFRTRVGLAYTGMENVAAFVQIQDSRTFGEETNTLLDGSADRFDLHQGYILADKLFVDPLTLKLGRMEVNYGSQRLIGAVDWHNIGRAFDGVILTVDWGRFVPDFFYFAEVDSVLPGERGDLNVFGMNADIITTESYKTQIFGIWQRNVPSDVLSRGTVGFYANGKLGNWGHETEAAYQFGNLTPGKTYGPSFGADSVEVDVSAFMVTLNVWYRFNTLGTKPGLWAGVDFLSGTKAGEPEGATFKSFDTLYATNHKFYGYMDYFIVIPVNTFGRGLVDMHGKVDGSYRNNTARLAFHVFQAHEDFVLKDGSNSKSFGSELDATFVHKYNKNLTFVLGASAFWAGDIFKETMGGNSSWWAYVMTTLNV